MKTIKHYRMKRVFYLIVKKKEKNKRKVMGEVT